MAMLEKAKKESEKKKKKHKHPAAKVPPGAPSQPENEAGNDDAGESEAGQGQQPDTGAEDASANAAPQGGEAAGPAPQGPQDQGGDSDQDDANGGGDPQPPGQNGQQGQGATPVPSPAAPGAGDTTSGGEDTPDQGQDQDPNAQPPETPGEDTAAGPGSNTDLTQIPMSPGLKDEYDKANNLLMQLLYKAGDDKLASSLLTGLVAQGPGKIQNASMLSLHVLVEIHKKLQLPPQIILPFAKDVVAHVMNLGQEVKQIQYSDQESTAILGCVVEGALRIFGVTKGQLKTAGHLFGKDALTKQQQSYQQMHAAAKTAIDKNNQDFHNPHLAPQQGPPQDAGPQTGAPVGAQSAPTSGAPPTPPPPPATPAQQAPAGGMLNQAAQGAQ